MVAEQGPGLGSLRKLGPFSVVSLSEQLLVVVVVVVVVGCVIIFFRREEKHELSLLGIFLSHNFINGSRAGTRAGKSKETFAPPIWTWTHAPLTQRGMGYWSIFSCTSI